MIQLFSVVLILDKDANAINYGKHVLFHLSKYFDKIYGKFVCNMQIEMSNLIQVPASLYLPRFQNHDFQDFLGSPCIN